MIPKVDYNRRIYGLDVFRALAIFLVVHAHGSYMLDGTFMDGFPWFRFARGVDMFFVLSGFLIGYSFIKIQNNDNGKLKFSKVHNFWRRTCFRILPNYFLLMLVNYILVKSNIINGDLNQLSYKNIFFIHNLTGPSHGFYWESWSLSVQQWFYFLFPLLFMFLLRISEPKKGLLIIIFFSVMLPLLYRISISDQQVDMFWWDVKFRKVVVTRIDTIFYGVFAAGIKFYYPQFWKKISFPSLIAGLAIIFTLAYMPLKANDFFAKTFFFSVFPVGIMLLFPVCDRIKNFRTFGGGVMVTHISLISYAMYLLNLLFAQIIQLHFPVRNPTDGIIKYGLFWIVVIVCSTILYFFYETPLTKLREKKK